MTSTASSSSPDELLSDEQLVARALEGNQGAFNDLVIRHERRLFRFLSRSAADPTDVEDAMQQAMLKAYLNLARYNPRWRFTTWLFTIALRELRSLRRGRSAERIEAHHDPVAPTVVHPIDNDDPGELWRVARRVLHPQHYTALWLRHGEDLPLADIAQIMSRPRIWVSVTIHRACACLRETLNSKPIAPAVERKSGYGAKGVIRGVL